MSAEPRHLVRGPAAHDATTPDTASGWVDDALCAKTGPDDHTWFPDRRGSATAAKALCGACPVTAACLDHAMTIEGGAHRSDRHGVWGGLTPAERWRLARARGRPCADCDQPVPSRHRYCDACRDRRRHERDRRRDQARRPPYDQRAS